MRRFLTHAETSGNITKNEAATTRTVLDQYEFRIKHELEDLNNRFNALATMPFVKISSLDDAMLSRSTELVLSGISLKPFDQAILASVLIGAERLWALGERALSFCEIDSDLQPWDRNGRAKPLLEDLYDQAHVWVYGDFTLTEPQRPSDFE